ncbi:MAG: crossover junction endodeoxyribonuclease RuvC [Candidatus Kerfeldbacteria bacterium]
MQVLGIDPGIEITGFAIVNITGPAQELVECGVIRTPQEATLPQRLNILANDLEALLKQYPEIALASVEELFFAKNVTTAFAVGQARGVVLYILERQGCPIRDVKPVEVKSIVTGAGNADKKDVQRIVQILFKLDEVPKPDDAADAVAIAIAGAALHNQQQRES